MERHDTHNLSCSSSEEHSYKLDNISSSKVIPSDNKSQIKIEEKNEWSKIILNNFKEIKNTLGIENESFNISNISKNQQIKEKYQKEYKRDIIEKNKLKKKEFSQNNKIIEKKEENEEKKEKEEKKEDKKENLEDKKEKEERKEIIEEKKEKIEEKKENIEDKKEKKEKEEKKEQIEAKKEKEEKKEKKKENKKEKIDIKQMEDKKEKDKKKIRGKNEEKYMLLNNGFILKKINQLKNDYKNQNNLINREKHINNVNEENKNDDNINDNDDKIVKIKKPSRIFITKLIYYKEDNNKKTYPNIDEPNLEYFKDNFGLKLRRSSSSIYPELQRKNVKTRTVLVTKNKNNNIDKFEEKFSSLSTVTPKQLSIYNNSNLFFNSSYKKHNVKKRPLSSNIIKKEIDLNLKSSKIENSFYNKSHTVQRICQISSFLNSNNNIIKISSNKKEIIYDNKNFFNELKELKNAFELSDNNIDINNNIYSERRNKNEIYPKLESNTDREHLLIKNRKLNSAKVRGRGRGKMSNLFYPSPLFFEFNNNIIDDLDKNNNRNSNICCKCDYKKHFGNEQNCPICISRKEENKLKEKKLSNLSYYYPFKDKYSNSSSIQNSFRNNKRKEYKSKKMNCENFLDFVNIKKEIMRPVEYYSPFNLYKMETDLTKNNKEKMNMNSVKEIKKGKNKIHRKYKALQAYFD